MGLGTARSGGIDIVAGAGTVEIEKVNLTTAKSELARVSNARTISSYLPRFSPHFTFSPPVPLPLVPDSRIRTLVHCWRVLHGVSRRNIST